MANLFRQITLNEKGLRAGPYFDVYYSTDCSDYTLAIDGANVFLPSINSQVIVTIPDTTQCLKLVNLSDTCGNNFVVENLNLTTTTTTTTTSTTTTAAPTTTTTTAGPTTTTTTLAPVFWNALYCNNGASVGIPLKLKGEAVSGNVVQAGTGVDTCATLTTVYTGTPIVFFDKTSATIYASCTACGITTTTTSTTTTAAPVWYYLYNCSNGETQTSAQYPAGTFNVGQRVVYGGALFFEVTSIAYTDPGGFKWSVSGTAFTGCPATTTTTTTTTLAPITLTTTPDCTGGFGTGTILANNFAGSTGTYQYIAIGTSESNAIANVGNPATRVTLAGSLSYTFTNLNNGNYWVALMDSTGRTGLSASNTVFCGTTTTTSTTTLQPGYFRALNCNNLVTQVYSTLLPAGTFNSGDRVLIGGVPYVIDGFTTLLPEATYTFTATGLFGCPATTTTTTTTPPALVVTNSAVTCTTITGAWRSSFSGGSGTYTFVAYSNSQANAITMLNSGTGVPGARVSLTAGDTYYDWSGIANGTWYVALKDSLGNTTVQNTSVVVNCTTTTTTTTTSTTTTTLQPVWYNLYNCYDGTSTTSAQYTIGTFSVGQRVAYGTGGSILYFNVVSEVTSNPGGIQWLVYSVAGTGCPATTTTTTTTTLPPMDFTYTTYCSAGQGYATITDITGGGSGQDQWSTNYGVDWYDWPLYYTAGPFANGTNPNIQVRNTGGGGTNKAIGVVNCVTTTTTTTTAAPATTTTTTTAPSGYAYVQVYNNFTNGNITDVTVNGVSIAGGASFPLAPGNNTSGTTYQIGTNEAIRVYFSSVSPSPSYIEVTGTDLGMQCELAAGTSNRLYNNVVIGSGQNVDIFANEGSCP